MEAKKAYLGVDLGSRRIKIVAIAPDKSLILKKSCDYSGRREDSLNKCLWETREELGSEGYEVSDSVSTGSGRDIAQKCGIKTHVNEIRANLSSTRLLYPQARTVFEIGGTDSKYIDVASGMSRLNQRCSSSTGTSLESLSGELNLTLDKFADNALRSKSPAHIDATCSVFARTNALAQIQSGISPDDVIMGYIDAMVDNYLRIATDPKIPIAFQGGVAQNKAVIQAFKRKLNLDDSEFLIPDNPLFMVAYGAALSALEEKATPHEVTKSKASIPFVVQKQRAGLFKDKEKPIVWLGNIVPPEIAIALGYRPVWPGMDVSRQGSKPNTGQYLRNASQKGFTEDCCSIQRLLVGLDSQNKLESPALIIGASSYCDFERDAFRVIANTRGIPLLSLDIPLSGDYSSRVNNLKEQLQQMSQQAAQLTGCNFNENYFAESIDWSKKIMQKMCDINELRSQKNLRVSSEMFGFTFSLPYIRGSSKAYSLASKLYDSLNQMPDTQDRNPRLLWDILRDSQGTLMGYANSSLAFESVNFMWPKDHPCHGISSISETREPHEALARMILSNGAIRTEDRLEGMNILVNNMNLNGVILYQHPHCPLTREYISQEFERKLEIPVLALNSDAITGVLDPITKTRLDSFLDYCSSRK